MVLRNEEEVEGYERNDSRIDNLLSSFFFLFLFYFVFILVGYLYIYFP